MSLATLTRKNADNPKPVQNLQKSPKPHAQREECVRCSVYVPPRARLMPRTQLLSCVFVFPVTVTHFHLPSISLDYLCLELCQPFGQTTQASERMHRGFSLQLLPIDVGNAEGLDSGRQVRNDKERSTTTSRYEMEVNTEKLTLGLFSPSNNLSHAECA